MPVKAGYLLLAGAGAVFIWSGIKGKSVSGVFRTLIGGDSPTKAANANTIAGTPQTTSGMSNIGAPDTQPGITHAETHSAAQNMALAKQIAVQMGHGDWTTGQAWQDWVSLWNQESGWNINAANPNSSARGIAQNINGYGPDYQQGNADSQITWGINYIETRYGSPVMAWAHEQTNNWY